MTAKQIHDTIKANVDAYYSNAIDYETFSAENRRLWDLSAVSTAKNAAVTKRVRDGLTKP